ncbi:pickpocket protein 28-like [Culex quinquefasciatus]|uniref:pickpocket protein 28-like n=1 Tax=Culex quinquefasciatus TaxID=7176 RepID=UPI0018E38770|nr:pickpocket protein 28-like [Culex quinquefasciatus]
MLHYEFKRTPFRQVLWEFCKENGVLAVRYASDRSLLKIERSWWILWIAAAFAACGFSVIQMYHKWDENPVVIVYAPKFAPISTVPFPAITMCPLSKARVDQFNLTQTYELLRSGTSLDRTRERKFRALAHVSVRTSLGELQHE